MSRDTATRLMQGTIVIVIIGVLAKMTAFLSEVILASYLGTSSVGDAYYMVTNIQSVVFPMLSVGIWKIYLPEYKSRVTRGELQTAQEITNTSITFFTLTALVVVGLLILFAGPVVSLVAPGFQSQTRKLCIELVRIAAPKYLFITAAAIYASMLQCHGKFFGSQIREVASHIPTILAALLLYRKIGIRAMAAALVAGSVLRLLVELPFVNWGYHFRPVFRFKNPAFSSILRRLPSSILSEGVAQINVFVDKVMASLLPTGTISGLNYGHRLINVFSGLLSAAVATALYPQMVELSAQKKMDALGRLVERVIRLFAVMMIPVSLSCILFRTELVSFVFERGSFNAASAALTAGIFAFYSMGLFFSACNTVMTNLYYGCGDTRTPLVFCVLHLVMNVILNLILIQKLGANGLALATSLSAILSFGIRFYASRKLISVKHRNVFLTLAKALVASAAAVVLPRLLFNRIQMQNYLVLILSALFAVPVYLAALKLFGVSELSEVIRLFRKLLHRRKQRD